MFNLAKNVVTNVSAFCHPGVVKAQEFVKKHAPDLSPYTNKINHVFQEYSNKTLDVVSDLSRKIEDRTGFDKWYVKRTIIIVPAFLATSYTMAVAGLPGLALRVSLYYMVSNFDWSYSSENVDDKDRNNPHWWVKNDIKFVVGGQMVARSAIHILSNIFSLNLTESLLKAATIAYVVYKERY